jgi:coproporphyrinogen III oxidase-like Fe-S oxidoreductase
MRLCEGVDYQAFASRFGRSFESVFGKGFSAYEPQGLVICDGAHCAFTTRGMLVSNAILSEVLDFSGEI